MIPDGAAPPTIAMLGFLSILGIGASACATSRVTRPAPPPVASQPPASSARRLQSEIVAVVNANTPRIKSCYLRALLQDESLEGGIEVRLDILTSGAVSHVEVQGPEPLRVMDACLKQAVATFVFPAYPEPYGTGFSYVFRRRDVRPP